MAALLVMTLTKIEGEGFFPALSDGVNLYG